MNNQSALINARLFEKGIRDALAGLTKDVQFTSEAAMFSTGTAIKVTATVVYEGRRLQANVLVHERDIGLLDGHFSLGKSMGFTLARQLLEVICEAQPQEITLSIKDISKARDKDNRVAAGVDAIKAVNQWSKKFDPYDF